MKLQVAIDYLSSYGMAIAIILVALLAIYIIALSPNNPPSYCNAVPGFNCNFISINSSGVLTAKFSQATGTQITINGIACSTQQSSATDTPAFGNVGVNSMAIYYDTPNFYPPGNIIYSGSSYIFKVYCYSSSTGIATSQTGQGFQGYLWINYTIPNFGMQTQKIATFSTIYS